MNVVVQNGAGHCLSKAEVEAMLPLFPPSWSEGVARILLTKRGGAPIAVFYPKSKELSLSCALVDGTADKAETIVALVVALAAVNEKGVLPQKLNESVRRQIACHTSEIQTRCIEKAVIKIEPAVRG